MDVDRALITEINQNRRELYITESEELLAAWLFKMRSSSKRTKNLCAVPTKLRCTHPHSDTTELMPCHVSIRKKAGRTFTRINHAPEFSTASCHGHGMLKKISLQDLNSLDRLESVTLARKCFAPYVSPFLDTITLARVARDLGIHGKVIPKVIKGRQYVAFSGRAGLRNIIRGTIYSSRNAKIINMAIGAMGISKMAAKGGVITVCITVPLSVLECYFRDRTAWYHLAGQIGMDLIKIGIASLIGAISGIALKGGSAFYPVHQ